MALTTAEVTTVLRNSGTRRAREDTDGQDHRANQVQQDTGGPAGILKDTSLRRFGTVRPGFKSRAPDQFCIQNRRFRVSCEAAGSQLGHRVPQRMWVTSSPKRPAAEDT